jgi:hypothetical protein
MEIIIENPKNVEETEVYKRDSSTWNPITKVLCFEANTSLPKKCWRLVYWNKKVKDLFESEGITQTINHLFCGIEQECLDKIVELKLEYNPEKEEGIDGKIRSINMQPCFAKLRSKADNLV